MTAAQAKGMALAIEGDSHELAWRALYDDQFKAIYRLVLSLGLPEADAEDVVQRTFLTAHRRLREGLAVESLAAWLRGIAVKHVREHRRWSRVRRVKHWLLRSTIETSLEAPVTPESDVSDDQTRREVWRVLDRMSDKLREVLVLAELEDRSLSEIASILAVPLNTVRSRRRLARERFEELWQESARRNGSDEGW
jgi:RNA polymerase sigma-70 factor (ECF subfamily)